jgi:hypothetical protein
MEGNGLVNASGASPNRHRSAVSQRVGADGSRLDAATGAEVLARS